MDILLIQTLSIYDPFIICNNGFWLYIWLTLPWARIQLCTLLFIFESLGSTYMYCYRNCLHNYNFIN